MADFLQRILDTKREEVATLRIAAAQVARASKTRRDLAGALRRPGTSVLAEIKRRSPSRGALRDEIDPARFARDYEAHGARAVSVLTDRAFFGGSADDLLAAREATALPVLRKDFLIAPEQIRESSAMGADAVLLIARILEDGLLGELLRAAGDLGLEALVEVHDEKDAARAVDAGATLIAVNSRDLSTFEEDPLRPDRLLAAIPDDVVSVAASAVRSRADVERLERVGFDAVLVGERLMRAPHPGRAVAELRGVAP